MQRVVKGHFFIGPDGDPHVAGAVAILTARRVIVPLPANRQRVLLLWRPWRRIDGWTDGRLGQWFHPDRTIGAPTCTKRRFYFFYETSFALRSRTLPMCGFQQQQQQQLEILGKGGDSQEPRIIGVVLLKSAGRPAGLQLSSVTLFISSSSLRAALAAIH
jgi:hypothetical protein